MSEFVFGMRHSLALVLGSFESQRRLSAGALKLAVKIINSVRSLIRGFSEFNSISSTSLGLVVLSGLSQKV